MTSDSSIEQQRHCLTLSKREIIRGYKAFTRVISRGAIIDTPRVKAYILWEKSAVPLFQVGFAVPRSFRKAVDRNRAKRILREAYRKNKQHLVSEVTARKSLCVSIVFLFKRCEQRLTRRNTYAEVEKDIQRIFEKLRAQVQKT